MASLLVLDVVSPKAALRGKLQRLLLEIRPGTFVGKLPSKIVKMLWDEVRGNSQSAIAVYAARNEQGFAVATHGPDRREPVDNEGITLMAYVGKNTKKSAPSE